MRNFFRTEFRAKYFVISNGMHGLMVAQLRDRAQLEWEWLGRHSTGYSCTGTKLSWSTRVYHRAVEIPPVPSVRRTRYRIAGGEESEVVLQETQDLGVCLYLILTYFLNLCGPTSAA